MTPEAKEHGIGYMDPEKMRDTRDLIFQLNDPKGTLQLNTAYTNEFLPGK
jgi:hypothetical protein